MQDSLLDSLTPESTYDKRRVIIIDYNHMAWRYQFSKAAALSVNRMVDGRPTLIDTTIPAYTIKAIARLSNFGNYPTIICLDSPIPSRRHYFKSLIEKEESTGISGADYKGERKSPSPDFFNSINIAANLMANGGIYVYKHDNYEADDLIFAAVMKAKKDYPYLPIDVITGDADLIPLVDEQVSVYMKSKRDTYHNDSSPLIKGYVQYTPESYQEYAQRLTKFKKLDVPYNTMLLAKILRGDDSDGLKGKPDWKPRMYNELMELLIQNDEPIEDIARYGEWTSKIIDKRTNEEVTSYTDEDKPHLFQQYIEPKELTQLCEILGKYVEDEDIQFIRERYIGMCLNGAFLDVPNELKRRPYEISSKEKFTGFSIEKLKKEVEILEIKLPVM